jgi:hypothetical protein
VACQQAHVIERYELPIPGHKFDLDLIVGAVVELQREFNSGRAGGGVALHDSLLYSLDAEGLPGKEAELLRWGVEVGDGNHCVAVEAHVCIEHIVELSANDERGDDKQ